MKKYLFIICALSFAIGANAQLPIFNPPSKPRLTAFGASAVPLVVNNIKFISEVSGVVSDGTQLAGGMGLALLHDKFVDSTQGYLTQWSVGIAGWLGVGTNGLISGTGGIVFGVPGTNGKIGIGGGRDFTAGKWVLITGVQFKFY